MLAHLPASVPANPVAPAHTTAYLARAQQSRPAEFRITVREGDTLSALAQRYCGKASDWPSLWWANREHIPDPSLIKVGQKLTLPAHVKVTFRLMARAERAIPRPAPAPVAPAAPAAPAPAQMQAPAPQGFSGAPGSFQACVIARESGGNPSAVNPYSGAGGLYQFLPSTWAALGFSGSPQNASVATQNAAFAAEYAQGGTSAWAPFDGC